MIGKKKALLFISVTLVGVLLVELCFQGSIKGPIKGLFYRTFLVPDIIRDHDFVRLNSTLYPNKSKQEFFSVYESKKGFYGLRRRAGTLEGYNITLYLITNNGHLAMILDYTRDPYGNRNFMLMHPSKVQLGFFVFDGDERKFVIQPTEKTSQDIILKIIMESGEDIYI